ncbi:MAG: hypothetical protein R2729_13650 [Bryobacteraceae bacterium]
MKSVLRACYVILLLAPIPSGAQLPRPRDERDPRLKPSQVDKILQSDREKSLEDAADLLKLAEELRIDLEKNDKNVLSVSAFKKTEEIEKLAKRIRGRMKRF